MQNHEPTEAELAQMSVEELRAYAATLDGEPEPIVKAERLDAVVSVRFALGDVEVIKQRAAALGMKPTTYIREMALGATPNLGTIKRTAAEASEAIHRLEGLLAGQAG